MNYKINWDIGGVFAVPDAAADSLRLASGKWVKVLLYMLRYRQLPGDPGDIGVTAEDIDEALSYWSSVGVISAKGEENTAAEASSVKTAELVKAMPDGNAAKQPKTPVKILAPKPSESAAPVQAEKPSEEIRPRKSLLPSEIAERIEDSEEIAFLFKSAEGILKRVLTFDDQRTILWFYDHLGMSADIIIMLIAHCCSIGKSNMGYIEKAALNWHEKSITTHEQAENEILLMQKEYSYEGKIKSLFHLQNISSAQKKYICEWARADISLDLAELAYDKTLDKKNKADFPYINGILMKWRKNGVNDVNSALEFDDRPARGRGREPQPQKTGGSAPSFDLSLIMEHAKNSKPTV